MRRTIASGIAAGLSLVAIQANAQQSAYDIAEAQGACKDEGGIFSAEFVENNTKIRVQCNDAAGLFNDGAVIAGALLLFLGGAAAGGGDGGSSGGGGGGSTPGTR